jgi:hypothetical protein
LAFCFLPSAILPLRSMKSTSPSLINLALEGNPFLLRSNNWTRASTRFLFPFPLDETSRKQGGREEGALRLFLLFLFFFLITESFIERFEFIKGFQARVDIANFNVAPKIVALRIPDGASGSIASIKSYDIFVYVK